MKFFIKIHITILAVFVFLCPLAFSSAAYETTPVEQDDEKTLNQVEDATDIENESTPTELDDMKTIDQINHDTDIKDDQDQTDQ